MNHPRRDWFGCPVPPIGRLAAGWDGLHFAALLEERESMNAINPNPVTEWDVVRIGAGDSPSLKFLVRTTEPNVFDWRPWWLLFPVAPEIRYVAIEAADFRELFWLAMRTANRADLAIIEPIIDRVHRRVLAERETR